MIRKGNLRSELYPIIGKLFYSIALVDKNVATNYVEQLKKNVHKYWLSADEVEDEFGVDVVCQIEIVFDCLQQEWKEAQIYFDEFVDYYRKHSKKFPLKIERLILKTADGIVASSAVKNKSEQMLLAKLWMLLN